MIQSKDHFPSVGLTTNISHFPWNESEEFLGDIGKVNNHTLVDCFRLYELWTLIEQVAKLPTGDILEVGVWRGGSGALMARKAARTIPGCNVYLCDTFTGVPKAGSEDFYKGGEHSDTSIEMVKSLLYDCKVTNAEILQGIFPDDTGYLIENNIFRLVHIDVDVWESAKDCTDWVWPKLVSGGIIVYDDYGHIKCALTDYVDSMKSLADRYVLYNLNGHGIVIKH